MCWRASVGCRAHTIDASTGSRYGSVRKNVSKFQELEITISDIMRLSRAVTIVVCITTQSAGVQAQQRGGTAQTDKVQPVNTGDNPYRVIRDWARLDLENRPWGGSNGVAIDRDGKSVWATDRCSPGTTPGCLGSKGNPVLTLMKQGKRSGASGLGCLCGHTAST